MYLKFCLLFLLVTTSGSPEKWAGTTLPEWIKGRFTDGYGNNYSVTDELFFMEPRAKYHIISWNEKEQYLLTRNDQKNPSEKGLYTRIDFMQFKGMEPYGWGFCLTVYNAEDTVSALKFPQADRDNPKKGCGGFPFSRMKRRVN